MVTERTPLLVQNARISGYVSIGKKWRQKKPKRKKSCRVERISCCKKGRLKAVWRKAMKKRLLSMLLICSSAPAHSLTGNEWLALWQGDDYDKFQAAGYLAGAWETQSFFGTGGKCHDEPIGVTLGQYRKVVIKFMESNPSTHIFRCPLFPLWRRSRLGA